MNQRSSSAVGSYETEVIWDQVAQSLEDFVAAWETAHAEPPEIAHFLPDGPPVARETTLVELVKVDMEQRRQREWQWLDLRDYARLFPELGGEQGFPPDLLYEAFHIRRADQSLTAEQFAEEHPAQREVILRLLGEGDPFVSTSLCHKRRPVELKPGDLVSDFELLLELGRGAFASVFMARQQSMQRLVAVKLSTDHGREPQTLARLDHPHIVRVYDQRTDDARGVHVLYMEYLPAGTLLGVLDQTFGLSAAERNGSTFLAAIDAILDERGLHPPTDSQLRKELEAASWWQVVCLLGASLADALEYAHQSGVLHRDIKPANILLTDTGAPKLADFNVSSCSKVVGASPEAFFGGSLAYMSPEQLEASNPNESRAPEDLDARSDVYSLAMVLWEMLTSSRPFATSQTTIARSNVLDVLTSHRRRGLQDHERESLPPDCPHGLQQALAKCLHPERERRYGSARELADRLRLCLHPEAELLLTKTHGLSRYVCGYPLLTMLTSLLIPNALAGWFNYVYNYESIIRPMNAHGAFRVVQLLINGIAYPAAFLIALSLVWRTAMHVKRRLVAEPQERAAADIRRSALRLGNRFAWLGIIEWTLAGAAYPVALWFLGAPMTGVVAAHFFGSLLLCGLIGATYPFFGSTAVVVGCWYPRLLRPESVPADDLNSLSRLESLSWRYLIMAGMIPLLALVVLTTWGRAENLLALKILSGGGLALFAITLVLARRIQTNLQLLISLAKEKRSSS